MSTTSFNPQGPTVAITVGVASSTAVQLPTATAAGSGPSDYVFANSGTQVVFVSFIGAVKTDGSGVRTVATDCPAAVVPTPGAPTSVICILANTSPTFTLSPGAWVATIAAATGSTLYITPGQAPRG